MLVGDPSKFAIESGITKAYKRLSFRALGYFVVHVAGLEYGVRSSDASMLAGSFDEVKSRVTRRGTHVAPLATLTSAGAIADAVIQAIYLDVPSDKLLFGWSAPEIARSINSSHILWGPTLDEAFDDSSEVLQFDVDDRVRLIGYRHGERYRHDPITLREAWMAADEFHGTLREWTERFEADWASAKKFD